MIVPKRLSHILACAKALVERETPPLETLVLTDFIKTGNLERIISKNRKIYESRRSSLVNALKTAFAEKITMSSESAGMDLFVRLDCPLLEIEILKMAQKAELPIVSAAPYYVDTPPGKEFIIPFSEIPEQVVEEKVKNWVKLLQM
jgi:GntR family transcriptional regulator/MocR family aminotransferase